MFEDGSKKAFVREVGVSISLSIKLLETSGKALEENETVDETIKLEFYM